MMNYVWSALLLAALGFALWFDFTDLSEDRYANGRPLPVALELPNTLDDRGVGDKPVRVSVHLPAGDLAAHFAGNDTAGATDLSAAAELVRLPDGYELRITETSLPAPLAAIRAFSDESNKILRARVLDLEPGIST
ncbi:MAG TPA: hypothetical protein PLD59_16780, partial [Tepidisphaeraceae bacterium]|nr:hypothetical protein [Tepidisphaeraceae bacterium]